MKIKRISSLKQSEVEFGNKALGIAWLIQNNFLSVDGICIAFDKDSYSSSNLVNNLNSHRLFKEILDYFPLAARSSSPIEDSLESSKAGAFLTITNIKSTKELYSSIDRVANYCFTNFKEVNSFAVIIQKFIKGAFSGILFTSNSVSGKKRQAIINICCGGGSKIVSGEISGNEYLIQQKGIKKISGDLRIPKQILSMFFDHVKRVKKEYKYPANIEWTIDNKNRLFFLQIRPITGITPLFNKIEQVGDRFEAGDNREKINLRYYSKQMKLAVSNGWKIHLSTLSTKKEIKLLISNSIFSQNILSVVLIKPNLLNKKIYREFCNKATITDVLHELVKQTKSHFLFFECIIKEILKPVFTGMIEKKDDYLTIEIARGHFIPKGVTSINHYLMNSRYELVSKKEPLQSEYYELSEDGPIRKEIRGKIRFSTADLTRIASTFTPLLDKLNCILEFGILKDKKLLALDYVDNTPTHPVNTILTGVISSGVIKGKLISYQDISLNESLFDTHKKNVISSISKKNKKMVVWALRPSLNLTSVIEKYGAGNIGFIFSELSTLSHFSIILRELGVPAIWLDRDISQYLNKDVLIDANSENIPQDMRLTLV